MPLKLFMYGSLPFPAQVYRAFPPTLLCEDDHSRRIRWGGACGMYGVLVAKPEGNRALAMDVRIH